MSYLVNTVNSKHAQLTKGSMSFGTGKDVLLVMGSCRVVPFMNYFHYANAGEKFTVHYIDPTNYLFDLDGHRTDEKAVFEALEKDERLLSLLRSVRYFVHEHYATYKLFNTSKAAEKNIYQYGLNPEHDITIPNYNDVLVLFQDFANLDMAMRREMAESMKDNGGKLGDGIISRIRDIGLYNIAKFYGVCAKSSFPEFADMFKHGWTLRRFFWTFNHISKHFTMDIFRMLDAKWLRLGLTPEFWDRVDREDMYANPHTPLTAYDVKAYGIKWNEPIHPLNLHLWQTAAFQAQLPVRMQPIKKPIVTNWGPNRDERGRRVGGRASRRKK